MRTQFAIVRRSEASSTIARMNSENISGIGGWGSYEGYPPSIGTIVHFSDVSGGPVVAEVICVHWECKELDTDDTKFIDTPEDKELVATMHGPLCVALCAYISGNRSDLKEP